MPVFDIECYCFPLMLLCCYLFLDFDHGFVIAPANIIGCRNVGASCEGLIMFFAFLPLLRDLTSALGLFFPPLVFLTDEQSGVLLAPLLPSLHSLKLHHSWCRQEVKIQGESEHFFVGAVHKVNAENSCVDQPIRHHV